MRSVRVPIESEGDIEMNPCALPRRPHEGEEEWWEGEGGGCTWTLGIVDRVSVNGRARLCLGCTQHLHSIYTACNGEEGRGVKLRVAAMPSNDLWSAICEPYSGHWVILCSSSWDLPG